MSASPHSDPAEKILYKLGSAAEPGRTLYALFTQSGQGAAWQMQVRLQGRRKSECVPLLETSVTCPLATVTLGGDSYALPIGWHERKRGGILCFGGERRTGIGGGDIQWEMRWTPVSGQTGRFRIEMRVRASARRQGDLHLCLRTRLQAPSPWTLAAAAMNGHCAQLITSPCHKQAVLLTSLNGDAGWEPDLSGFTLRWPRFPLGGGKCLRLELGFLPAPQEEIPRAGLVQRYAALAQPDLNPAVSGPALDPSPAAAWLTDPAHYDAPGVQRLYLRLPDTEAATFWGGAPHYPLEALLALGEWNKIHPHPEAVRLIRYGALGIAADFQVMGRAGESEPNKGAFWDKNTNGVFSDAWGNAAHGIESNSRIARALFLLHEATGEELLRQSALNICQWLLLKMNAEGWYDGAHIRATRGLPDDGRAQDQPCALDGAQTIRPFILAFQKTRNEVFIKAAWKVANALLARMTAFNQCSPVQIAFVLRALLALDAEAPNERLRAAIKNWGTWLQMLPLHAGQGAFNADGRHSGLYDCAGAGMEMFTHTHDIAYLRYACAALNAVPDTSHAKAWRVLDSCRNILLSLAALLPQSAVDFDRGTVTLDWRVYTPDPATEQYIQVRGEGGVPIQFLPLVCRASDQVLLLVLAPFGVDTITILRNRRRPVVRDLLTGLLDTQACLHKPGGEPWARVGVFTIDP